ncbi:hypothetical protein Hanom_Chr06g00548751 [Helianthus anomalus]
MEAIGSSSVARSCCRADPVDRQSGKPGPTGNPAERMALRSGGNAKPNSASALANSLSDNPGWTWIPEFFKWVKTLLDKDVKEMRLLRGGSGVDGDDVAALAERRRRPARCAGFRPVILLSTSTIFGGKIKRKRGSEKGEVRIRERKGVVRGL